MRRKQHVARSTEEPKTCLRRRCVSPWRLREDESERKEGREGGLGRQGGGIACGCQMRNTPMGPLHASVVHKWWSHRLTPGNRADELGSWLVGNGSNKHQHQHGAWSVRQRLMAYQRGVMSTWCHASADAEMLRCSCACCCCCVFGTRRIGATSLTGGLLNLPSLSEGCSWVGESHQYPYFCVYSVP